MSVARRATGRCEIEVALERTLGRDEGSATGPAMARATADRRGQASMRARGGCLGVIRWWACWLRNVRGSGPKRTDPGIPTGDPGN